MYCIESKYEIEKRQQRPVVILWILIKVNYTNKLLVKNNGLSFKIWNHNINKQILEIQFKFSKKVTKSPNLLCKHHMGDFVKLLWLSWKTLENGPVKKWYFVIKIVVTYCEKKIVLVKFLRSLEQVNQTVKGQKKFW